LCGAVQGDECGMRRVTRILERRVTKATPREGRDFEVIVTVPRTREHTLVQLV
jgi:hypothetical protein